MRRRRSQSGVTLMELLIAITLVSLLSVSMLMAMRVGFNAMEKTNNRIIANRRAIGTQRILDQQIAGMIVMTAACQANTGGPPIKMPFFQGQPQTMRFVSSYSLQEAHRGYPRILEYQVIPHPEGLGVRLIVNERLYSGPRSAGQFCLGPGGPGMGGLFLPVEIGPQSFVLADQLAFCRFAFLEDAPPPLNREWVPLFTDQAKFPRAIRIEMAPLQPKPGNIPLLSLTAPVRVNRIPGAIYEDLEQAPR
jgi:prepilin-type N-terminal cleavage/methylation domain-containing protein